MKPIKLGRTLIRCIEIIEQQPHITGLEVSKIVGVECDCVRSYLSRVSRQGLIVKHRPKGSLVPTFTAVEGWRERIEFRHDIGSPREKRPPRKKYIPREAKPLIEPLPMGEASRALPTRIINSVFALGQL